MELVIRVAEAQDKDSVVGLWNKLHDYHVGLVPEHFQKLPETWVRETFDRNLASPWTDFLIAAAEGQMVGFCLVGIEDPTHPGVRPVRRGIIYELVVDPPLRSQGIGRRLSDEAAEWSRLRGARQMALYVFEGNPRAVDFYLKTGWHVEMRRMVRPIRSP